MIYQVRANLYFTDHDEAVDFYHDCQVAYPKSIICNPDTEAAEYSIIELIQNHHDESPNAECGYLDFETNRPPEPV